MYPSIEVVMYTPTESAEDALNTIIDILQEKLIHKVAAGEDAGVYVGMIAGVCDGYLKCKKEDQKYETSKVFC